MPLIADCINHDFCHGYTDRPGGLCVECAERERRLVRQRAGCLGLLWRWHERSMRRKIVRRDGGEGMDHE